MTLRDLERILYFEQYVVIEPGLTDLKAGQLLSEEEYLDAQDQAGEAYMNSSKWAKMAIHNVAGSGKFSSDRTISEYADGIWGLKPVRVSPSR